LKRVMAQTKVFEGAGTIGGRARLRGTGDSVDRMVANGDGGLTVVMSGGEISALLIELAGLDITESLGFATGIKRKPENTHNIRCMVIDSDLRQGVLGTKTLVFDTSDTNITGRATIDFRNEGLDARLEPHTKDMSILTFKTPINVHGTLKHPTITPDPVWSGGRVAASIALGVLFTPLAALIPTIDLGLGEDSDCGALIADARAAAAPPPQPKPPQTATRK
jgi:AsmA family protein